MEGFFQKRISITVSKRPLVSGVSGKTKSFHKEKFIKVLFSPDIGDTP